jgi:hypothetical protein
MEVEATDFLEDVSIEVIVTYRIERVWTVDHSSAVTTTSLNLAMEKYQEFCKKYPFSRVVLSKSVRVLQIIEEQNPDVKRILTNEG